MFCTKCGQKLADEAAYCSACGAIVEKSVAADQGSRKQVYVGEIKKCPNCGEALSAFEIKCHSCGYELRNIKASSAIQEFYEIFCKNPQNLVKQRITPHFLTTDHPNYYEFTTKG